MSTTERPSRPRDPKVRATRQPPVDGPSAPEVLARARQIVADYQVVMWFEDGEFYGRGVELPGALADGPSADACMANVREAFAATVATMIEDGDTPPLPAAR